MRHTLSNPITKAIAVFAMGSFSLLSSLEAQIRYELVVPEVLGSPVNRTNTRGNEINENSEILLNRISTFAVWKAGTTTHIVNANTDYPKSLSRVEAASMNAYQQTVGTKTYLVRTENGTKFDTFPFYWDPANEFVDLDDLGERSANGAGSTSLFGINKLGLAIGTSQTFEEEEVVGNKAFVWSFETGRIEIPALDTIESKSVTTPQSINDSGSVVGTYRQFLDSSSHYNERAFVYDQINSSRDLASLNSDFFQSTHYTARDINENQSIVGERDRQAYWYNLDSGAGYTISPPALHSGSVRAYTLNDYDVVAGSVENQHNSGHTGFSPIIWTRETGSVDLLPHLKKSLSKILPQGVNSLDCQITPKAINKLGQISARLETQASFSREIVLNPVLDFQWASMTPFSENGVRGVLYSHDKNSLGDTIPVAALGYEIGFECSADMKNWSAIPEQGAIRKVETADSIELFVPFADCTFIRPVLTPIASSIR